MHQETVANHIPDVKQMVYHIGEYMNDFTKDELKDLLSVINESITVGTQPECIHILRDKIQSMIYDYDAQVIQAWHCEKCGHVQ